MEYNVGEIEEKWRRFWEENETFKTENDFSKPKYYVLDMFPYPSGAGLHVGHPLGYIASDIFARYMRLKGYNVLHPMGYDAFGLPAEQYAIQTGQHPAKTTEENIKRYRAQLDKIGFSFDWSRQVKTCDPNYYKWTQWIFMQLFNSWFNKKTNRSERIETLVEEFDANGNEQVEAACSETDRFSATDWKQFDEPKRQKILLNYRLAYLADSVVNWCPALGTVLANDEVKDGRSERGGHPVEQKKMKQWSLRITAYSQRLLDGLKEIDWSDSIKEIQTNWIGRSEGASVHFQLDRSNKSIEVFTTRPDTIFGVTFMVLAPEHEMVKQITTGEQQREVDEYIQYAGQRSERERMSASGGQKVTGAFTGTYAIHPFTEEKIPIWISDYVLAGYGTGAVMAVPSGDQRDWDFAHHFDLPIPPVIDGQDITNGADDSKEGTMINSSFLNGMKVPEAIETIIRKIEERGIGERQVQYKMRDAVFGRQRYWGEPIPVYYKDGVPYLVKEEHLPLELPEVDKFLPTEDGQPPLKRAEKWHYHPEKGVVSKDEGYPLELTTMPGWAGSSWYYLRYMNAENEQAFASKEATSYWGPVDFYLGGAEHATGHLLYFRFWTKVLHDLGYLGFDEPAKKLVNQGMIQGKSAILNRYDLPKKGENETLITYGTEIFISAHFAKELLKGRYTPYELYEIIESQIGKKKAEALKISLSSVFISQVEEGLKFDNKPHPYRTPIYIDVNYCAERVVDDTDYLEVNVNKLQNNPRFSNSIFIRESDNETFLATSLEEKMSKSKLNVINPDDVIAEHGADALRLHEMFLGPIEMHKPWNTKGIEGVTKFLRKLWRLYHDDQGHVNISDEQPSKDELKSLHKAIKKFREDTERFSFNTSVSTFMVAVNELTDLQCNKREILEPLAIIVSCHAPHIAEELWQILGHNESISKAKLPEYNEEYLKENTKKYPVQFNGKVRFLLELPLDMPKEEVEKAALEHENAEKWLEGKPPKKVIVVPGKIINVVV